ncbi:hypothetical protein B0H17DRAFT_1146221 [Mycena rosella]|uniref:Uncharacterized protein n=1 Tax=Mycena rosella TaxID=1033263 RepID=A0AAD7CP83_MYCRO|nr:hypothetical protein B0H17DRAFT_1146221 [Mycena rosella]
MTQHGGNDAQSNAVVASCNDPHAPCLPPDLTTTPFNTTGHLWFPVMLVLDNESNWGASEDERTDEEIPITQGVVPIESPVLQTGPANAESFARLHFNTVEQAWGGAEEEGEQKGCAGSGTGNVWVEMSSSSSTSSTVTFGVLGVSK